MPSEVLAQVSKYRIYFTEKSDTGFDPLAYFDKHTLERRKAHGLPIYDWYDLPVNPAYLKAIEPLCERVLMHSRWMNAAVVLAHPDAASEISHFPFVKEVEWAAPSKAFVAGEIKDQVLSESDSLVFSNQIERMGASLFEERGLNGNGIRIAIFDVGFSGADKHPAFDHLRAKNRILKTWDFVTDKENVYLGGWHGTAVWSCVGGKLNNKWSGLAWDAEFLLARTEMSKREPFSEEENWVAAAEWADKNGADIINSSLGYTDSRYFPEQMNGKKSFISRGANMAAKKGMLVVNAAGNEGDGAWKIIGAPADADSVLSVGGLEPCCDYHISFSSFGPTADKRLKPNVSAQGRAYCAADGKTQSVDGTSFASPLTAGFAACVWQSQRSLSNMDLFKVIERSGHLYPYFDYAHGYGLPHASRIENPIEVKGHFKFEKDSSGLEIRVRINEESFVPNAETGKQMLYYSLVKPNGLIESYYVIDVDERLPLLINVNEYAPGTKLRVSFKGQTEEIAIR